MRKSIEILKYLLKAKTECIWINTFEETEAINDIKEIIAKGQDTRGYELYLWSLAQGLTKEPLLPAEKKLEPIRGTNNIQNLFKFIQERSTLSNGEKRQRSTIFVLRDFQVTFTDASARRWIRDLKESYIKSVYAPIIIIAPSSKIPSDLAKLFYVIDYDLPNIEELKSIVNMHNNRLKKAKEQGKRYTPLTDEEMDKVASACSGLTLSEANTFLQISTVKDKTIDINFIMQSKIQSVKKSGVLDYKIPKVTLDNVGGNNAVVDYLNEVKDLFSKEAQDFGLTKPKGIMCVGLAGCGKTLIAEAFAGTMEVPLLILSMSKIMNRMVGESEKAIAQALKVAKASAPCVLLLDEAEKGLGGLASSNQSDSGITARVFQEILNFMNDNDNGVYVIMTSNDVSQLPPELTRSGRIDAQWYFSYPDKQGREDIFNIHLKKYHKSIDKSLLNAAADRLEHYTGAEIEEVVKNCMRKTFIRSRKDGNTDIIDMDLFTAIDEVIPIFDSSREKILALEHYCKGRARNSNYEAEEDIDTEDEGTNALIL